MKKRILFIKNIQRKKKVIIALLLIFITTITTGITVANVIPENEHIKNGFYQSVNYNPAKNLLIFTIPKKIPEGYRFYLHVSGRLFMGDKSSGMSFHAFDKEGLNYTWKSGKTYTYPLHSINLDFIALNFGLQDKNTKKLLYEYVINISPDGTKSIILED